MTKRVLVAVDRVKSVFEEIPGTLLSIDQASRLAGVDRPLCESIISALEDARFVRRTPDGRYRSESDESPRW
jgi:hypothetical protein